MNPNIDLKEVWNKQKPDIPEIDILYKRANRFRRNNLYKLAVLNLTFLLTTILIGLIWYYYQPKLVTTKIGIILTVVAMIVFIVSHNFYILILKKCNESFSSKDYMHQLIKLQERQIFQQTTMLSIYFLLLSIGIGLYMLEFVAFLEIIWAVMIYLITILWFAINWFYLRPRIIKKQNDKLNKLLLEFKNINNQLST